MHAHSTPRNADDKCLKINPCFTEGDSGRYSYQAETTPSTINNDSYQSETIPSTINNDSDNNRDTEISEYVDNFLKRTSSFRKVFNYFYSFTDKIKRFITFKNYIKHFCNFTSQDKNFYNF